MTETLESAYRQHADELIRFATTMVGPNDASDVVTDAMVAAFARNDDLSHVANTRAYLFRAVHNRIVDVSRSRSRRERREARYELSRRPATAPPDSSLDARAALAELSEQQRAATFMAYWCDMSPAEIAAALDVTEGTIRKQLSRARARLREVLDV
jgi:RNA polymerase sigma factor (sigma-70 family)